MTTPRGINLQALLITFNKPWSPRAVGTVNDYDIRVARSQGEFTPPSHPETDELFLVLTASLTIKMDDGDMTLGPGEAYIVPRGALHQPVSAEGATVVPPDPPRRLPG